MYYAFTHIPEPGKKQVYLLVHDNFFRRLVDFYPKCAIIHTSINRALFCKLANANEFTL